jgi:hypothetical protein
MHGSEAASVKLLGMLGGGAFTVVSFAVGLRLAGLSLRTRQLPELLIGASMLLLAGVGYPLSAVARESIGLSQGLRAGLGALAGLLGGVGLTSNAAFTFVLFRRHERWARAFVVGVGLFSLGLYLAQSGAGDWVRGEVFWGWLPFGITLSYGWCFVECGRYHLLLRRRLRIGLSDPVVTDRFGLYAAATGMAVVTNSVGQLYWWLGREMLTDQIGSLLLVVLGSGSTVLMWLAFLPPRAYLARVRARTVATT